MQQQAFSPIFQTWPLWAASALQYPSELWGLQPAITFLEESIVRPGHVVADLGCGEGFSAALIASMVGTKGKVIGIDVSDQSLARTASYRAIHNLTFQKGDVAKKLPLETESVDVATCFMVCHMLKCAELQRMFKEMSRVLKPGGQAVLLTMHPKAFELDWELAFLQYNPNAVSRLRSISEKEGTVIPLVERSLGGIETKTLVTHHTRRTMVRAAERHGLGHVPDNEQHLWIDPKTAAEKYGPDAVLKRPDVATYWLNTYRKRAS